MELEKLIKKVISYTPRSPFFKTRINRKKNMVIIHTTQENFENYCDTSTSSDLDVYTNEKGPLSRLQLSPHYFILDDWKFIDGEVYSTIINMVGPNNVAHHAGESSWMSERNLNENSLGIEIRGYTNQNLTRAQYNSLYALVEFLVEEHDIPINRVLGHYEVAPERRTDPGEKIMKNIRSEMVDRLHKSAFIIDAHQDTLINVLDSGMDISMEYDKFEVDIPRLRKGNVGAVFFALYTKASYKNKGKRLRKLLDCFNATLKNHSKDLMQVKRLEDLDRLDGRIGVILSVENASGIGNYVSLDDLYMSGLRCLSLTHNTANQYATGILGNPNRGITRKGKDLVERMKRLGILVDVSHLNEKSFWDVIECNKRPVIASHSNVFNVHPHLRNLKDDQIKAIAERGGVIGINFWRDVIGYQRRAANLVYHVDYLVDLVGIDHVGLGTDFGVLQGQVPKDIEDISKLKNFTKALVDKGYKNSEVRKILGLNYVRLFGKAWF